MFGGLDVPDPRSDKELIRFLAYVHDALQGARKTHNDLAEAAVQAVEAALDAIVGYPGGPMEAPVQYLYILEVFAGACPETPYPLLSTV